MSTETAMIAGVQFIEQRPTHDTNIEYWLARSGDRLSEVFLLPKQHRDRLNSLPNLIGFTQCRIVDVDAHLAVIMPGVIQIPTTQMIGKIGVTSCIGMAWHISDMLSLLHQSGRSHNLLHPESIGLNDLGELEIRPALGRFIASDPDAKASAIATDCWQMRQVIQHLGISGKVDPLFALLNRGLQEELARLRLQPATAIRQSIAAVLARHSEWEENFVSQMGSDWVLNQRNLQENTIIPHRLKSIRPTLSIDDVKDMADSIDLWGNLFTSSSIDEASSSQALLLEALSGKQPFKEGISVSKITLPTHRVEPIEEPSSKLEIDLIGPTSIQVPVQTKRPGLVSIQEVGLDETSDIGEQDYYHGFSAIVEETADNLEVIHRRRRSSQSRRDTNPYGDSLPLLSEEQTEVIVSPAVGDRSFDRMPSGESEYSQKELNQSKEDIGVQDVEPRTNTPSESILIDAQSSHDRERNSLVELAVDVENHELEEGRLDRSESELIDSEGSEQDISTFDPSDELSSDIRVGPVVLSGFAVDPLATEDKTVEEKVVESSVIPPDISLHSVTENDDGLEVDEIESRDLVGHIEPADQSSIENSILDKKEIEKEEIEKEEIESEEASKVEVFVQSNTEIESGSMDIVEDLVDSSESIAMESELGVSENSESIDMDFEDISIRIAATEDFIHAELRENIQSEDISVDDEDIPTSTESDLEGRELDSERYTDVVVSSRPSILMEKSEESSEESEETNPVSIHNMPLVSIVEEDDFNSSEDSEESEDEAGVSLAFLIEPKISTAQLNEVFEEEVSSTGSANGEIATSEPGFVATLNPENSIMSTPVLDVEEPLADIEFPSIEEVRAQDQTFAGDVNSLFDSSGLFDSSEPVATPYSHNVQSQLATDGPNEPKWTGATSFDNLTNSEDALGDEKYAYAQVELGDVDAVLGESIRDFSELERRGSPWGLLLIGSLILICVIVYVLNLDTSSSASDADTVMVDTPAETIHTQVEIQTDPPRGSVLIQNNSLGVAPIQWEITDGDVFLMCVDWDSNPVCRKIPRSDLQVETYTFTHRLTP